MKRLYIKDYKILKDFTLEFPHDFKKYISIFIGDNGSGKSTVLEAIAQIFSDAILNKPSKFGFELEYSVRHEELIEETSTTSEMHIDYVLVKLFASDKDKIVHVTVQGANGLLYEGPVLPPENMVLVLTERKIKAFSVLPDNVVIYYSGLSETMKGICKPHEEDASEQLRGGGKPLENKLFYFEPWHYKIILLSLLSYEFGDIPDFLRDKAHINGISGFQLFLRKPKWARDTVDNFWGAKGTVRRFLDFLKENDGSSYNPEKPDNNRDILLQIISDELLVISFLSHESLYRIRGFVLEEKQLFEVLNMMAVDGLLHEIEIGLHHDVVPEIFQELSEGEKQAVIVRGLNELFLEKNSLFLFDEPDTYLHPKWQRHFIEDIEGFVQSAYNAENSYLIATHSPQLLSKARADTSFVKIMEKGKVVKNTPKHYGRDIATVLYEMMGVAKRPKEIHKELNRLFRFIDEGNYDEADKLYGRLEVILGSDDPGLVDAWALKELLMRKTK